MKIKILKSIMISIFFVNSVIHAAQRYQKITIDGYSYRSNPIGEFFTAIRYGGLNTVRAKLPYVDINVLNVANGLSPLSCAILYRKKDIANLILVQQELDINKRDIQKSGTSSIALALQWIEEPAIALKLLENNTLLLNDTITIRDKTFTLLDYAAQYCSKTVLTKILSHPACMATHEEKIRIIGYIVGREDVDLFSQESLDHMTGHTTRYVVNDNQ